MHEFHSETKNCDNETIIILEKYLKTVFEIE